MQRFNALGARLIELVPAVPPHAHQTDIAQNTQMFGYGGLFQVELFDDIGYRPLSVEQEDENLPASRLSDSIEDI